MSSPADSAKGGMFPGTGIDRSVAYLIGGIVIIFLFLLTIFGMGRVEKITSDATQVSTETTTTQPSEIGGFAGDAVAPGQE